VRANFNIEDLAMHLLKNKNEYKQSYLKRVAPPAISQIAQGQEASLRGNFITSPT
jgi:hypothetical protein